MRRPLLLSLAAMLLAPFVVFEGAAGSHRARLSLDLVRHAGSGTRRPVRVIVHGDRDTVQALAERHGARVRRFLAEGGVLEATGAQLDSLSRDPDVDHLSGDLRVRSMMTVSNQSTGADQVRAGSTGLLGLIGASAGVTGQGIGVAVIDSGIAYHATLANKVVVNVSFVDGRSAYDEHGHGTHVAGIIAGSAGPAKTVTSLYNGGIAPGVRLVNLRVLGPDGSGLTSDVIAAIDWAIANRQRYNIRAVNLSLGHPVAEPSADDPLCEAVARAVSAGMVVVASAGNHGKAEDGRPILGGVTSPGNSPYAITVGALNTWGTVGRSDDTVATYSSRGPTRFDLAVKPDVVAPGNKLISLEASGSYLATNYGAEHVAGSASNAYYRLSGSSMAAAVVSGGTALLLQVNPYLDPRRVKLALQASASYMVDAGLMGGGAGSVNLPSARTIAEKGLLDVLPIARIAGWVVSPGGAAYWDAGTLTNRLYGGVGLRLIGAVEALLIWANPSLLAWGDLNLWGLTNPIALLGPNRVIWGDISFWTTSHEIHWGDPLYTPEGQGVIWGDSETYSGGVIWGDSAPMRDPY